MSKLTLPRAGIPLISGDRVSPEWFRFFHDLNERVGGVSGSSNDDLAASQFEDAGIEETKALLARVADAAAQVPPHEQAIVLALESLVSEVEEMRGQLRELTKAIEALQQGMNP
jgi:ABC-type transporter Mla subunit MlaD